MNNSRERLYPEYSHQGMTDRNRSSDKHTGLVMNDLRSRYGVQQPSPTALRRDNYSYRQTGQDNLNLGGTARDSYARIDPPQPSQTDPTAEKLRQIERLQQKVAALEATNKQLYEDQTKKDRKVGEILKTVKEDNQILLKNLKKLLTKQVINSEALQYNPASQKFISKLREMMASGTQIPTTMGGGPPRAANGSHLQNSSSPNSTDTSQKLTENENSFILQELKRTQDTRGWVSALCYSKHPTLTS